MSKSEKVDTLHTRMTRDSFIALVAPIIEEMESRYPERAIAGRIWNEIQKVPVEVSDTMVERALAVYWNRPTFPGSSDTEAMREALEAAVGQRHKESELRQAAMWVMLMWDTQQSQHGTMGRLREVLGYPRQRPTVKEARERMDAYMEASLKS